MIIQSKPQLAIIVKHFSSSIVRVKNCIAEAKRNPNIARPRKIKEWEHEKKQMSEMLAQAQKELTAIEKREAIDA